MFKSLIKKTIRARSNTVIDRVNPYIEKSKKIIDIGSGTGDVALLLKQSGKDITPVDVADFHGIRVLETTIYDGKKLPFPNKSFDTALLLMVLHHTPDPQLVFSEAARVAKEIVVIETSYTNSFDKFLTVVADAIGNLRLNAFWKCYKTDKEWRELFAKNGFKVVKSQQYHDRSLGIPFLHIAYYLQQ